MTSRTLVRFRAALAALALCAPGVCPAKGTDLAGLSKPVEKSAGKIAPALRGRVCVMDLTEVGDPAYSSELGVLLAERLSGALTMRKERAYEVVARQELVEIVRDSMVFGGDDVFDKLRKAAGMDVLVTGQYAVAGPEISVQIKAVGAADGKVVAADSFVVRGTGELEKMAVRRFRRMPAAEEEKAASGGDVLEIEAGVYYQGGEGKLHPVREGMVLTSRDNYAIYLRPRTGCHLFVYQVDSAGKVFRLFPNPEFSLRTNPIKPGEEVWVPHEGYLFLDENLGQEQVFILATPGPSPSLEDLREWSLPQFQAAIRTMGVGGRRGAEAVRQAKGPQGTGVELLSRRLAASGGFFYQVSFLHRQ